MQDKQEINAQGRGVNAVKTGGGDGERGAATGGEIQNEWDYSVHRKMSP